MIRKLQALWDLMKKGRVVADPAKWKQRQITASMLVSLIWALVNFGEAIGINVQIDTKTVDAIAVCLLALVNWVLTLVTSDKVGLQDKRPAPA